LQGRAVERAGNVPAQTGVALDAKRLPATSWRRRPSA
jgi:hypothetical protein